jgi:hypothetical protein
MEEFLVVAPHPEILVVKLKCDCRNIGLTLARDGRNPCKVLRLQVVYLRLREQVDSSTYRFLSLFLDDSPYKFIEVSAYGSVQLANASHQLSKVDTLKKSGEMPRT